VNLAVWTLFEDTMVDLRVWAAYKIFLQEGMTYTDLVVGYTLKRLSY